MINAVSRSSGDPLRCVRLLRAQVEIGAAAGHLESAVAAAGRASRGCRPLSDPRVPRLGRLRGGVAPRTATRPGRGALATVAAPVVIVGATSPRAGTTPVSARFGRSEVEEFNNYNVIRLAASGIWRPKASRVMASARGRRDGRCPGRRSRSSRRGQLEVEDVDVLRDAAGLGGLRDHRAPCCRPQCSITWAGLAVGLAMSPMTGSSRVLRGYRRGRR